MQKSEELLKEIRRTNHQGLPMMNFFYVMKEYWPLGQYMLKKFGWKSWHSFWYTKLFVSDEGGEYSILDSLLYKRFPSLLRKPAKIEIEHTINCNKKCIFCTHTYWKEKKGNMTFEQFKKIIDDIDNLKWINLAGIGSNFMNKDFYRIIAYARRKHINVNFVDEFDFFDEKKARQVIDLGINSIFVSFDAATKSTYEIIKKGCNFDRSLTNIKTLLRLKEQMKSPFPVVHFRFIVSSLNYREMPAYIELIHKLGNRGTRSRVEFIGLITFPGIEQYHFHLEQVPEDIMVKTLENAVKYNINLYFSHAGACLPSMSNCVRWAEPFILVNGDVISDCAILMQSPREFLREHSFGNTFKSPFMDIWNSNKYREFRKLVVRKNGKVPKSCYGCCAYDTEKRAKRYGIERQTCLS